MYTKKKSTYTAALYLRLSREDEDKAESDSIQNQRELIKQFVSKHPEIKKTQEFIDDGFSGTNFERPGFIRMMNEIESHRIDCVIVKDLSRLGRTSMEDMYDRFPGKVYCKECQKRMWYRTQRHRDRDATEYWCKRSDRAATQHHAINADFLQMFVADQIHLLINSMCDRRELIEKAKRESKQTGNLYRAMRKAGKLKVEISQTENRIAALYEDLADGAISNEEYQELKEH